MKTPDELKARDLIRFLDGWHKIQGDAGSVMIDDLRDIISRLPWLTINTISQRLTAKSIGLWLRELARNPIRRDPHKVYHIQFCGRRSAGMRWRLIAEQEDESAGEVKTDSIEATKV